MTTERCYPMLAAGRTGRITLLAGAAAICAPLHIAHAQEAGSVEEQAVNEQDAIIVTGSRIRGVAPVGSNLIGLSRESVVKSGATTVSEILRQVPQVTSLSINAEGATGIGASSNIIRATGPNLRGLGSAATLTLLDGNRVPMAGTQSNFVDPAFLPSIALQRIEIIADGASAIYGSDAISGVINLIPRKNFVGLEFRGRAGFADGYEDYQVGAIGGTDWGSGNFVLSAEWTKNTALLANQRDFVSADRRWGGGADARSLSCDPATITAGGVTYAIPGTPGVIDFATLTPGTTNRCDVNADTFLIPEQDRKSAYAYVSQDLGDFLRVFAQGVYTQRQFSGPNPAQSTVTNLVVPRTNAFYPINVPAGTNISVSTNFQGVMGVLPTEGESELWQLRGGGAAQLGAWQVELAGSYAEGSDEENRAPSVLTAALSAALASSDPAAAVNPFFPSANNRALVESFYLNLFNPQVTNRLRTVSLEANGPLLTLPGGDVRMAIGAEYRDERSYGLFTSGSLLAPILGPSDIGRNLKAVYAELYVPLLGPGNAAGVGELDLLAAVRHEDYSDFGSTTNPKIGLTWRPSDDLKLRGSYGTSFRAPGLADINPRSSGAGVRLNNYTIGGNPVPLSVVVLAAGNPDLRPETAETWSAGIDFTPTFARGLRLSATYFDITYENQVVDVFTIVPQVLSEPANFADIVFFNDGGARYQEAVQWLQNSQYAIPGQVNFNLADAIVDGRKNNLGITKASGMDFEVGYYFSSGTSDFDIGFNATWFFNYEDGRGTGALTDRLNTYGFPQRFRARGFVGWSLSGFSTQASVNYLNAYRNMTSTLVRDVSSHTTVDLDVSYTFEDGTIAEGTRIGVNVRNLFDTNPPFVDAGMGYDPSAASALGRIVSLSASKRF
jgi:iron complex outermembrane recepter protein